MRENFHWFYKCVVSFASIAPNIKIKHPLIIIAFYAFIHCCVRVVRIFDIRRKKKSWHFGSPHECISDVPNWKGFYFACNFSLYLCFVFVPAFFFDKLLSKFVTKKYKMHQNVKNLVPLQPENLHIDWKKAKENFDKLD